MLNFFINNYGVQICGLIILAICGCAGLVLGKLCKRYVNDDTKRAIACTVVLFVQQVWYDLDGPSKLNKALETAEALLKKKGIKFDADEMKVLIEAALAELKEVFKTPLEAEYTSDAIFKPDPVEDTVQ